MPVETDIDLSIIESLQAEFNEEKPCEHKLHHTSEHHDSNSLGVWYGSYSCPSCPFEGTTLYCERWVMLGRLGAFGVLCGGCRQRYPFNEFFTGFVRRSDV